MEGIYRGTRLFRLVEIDKAEVVIPWPPPGLPLASSFVMRLPINFLMDVQPLEYHILAEN